MADLFIEHLTKTYRRGVVALRECTLRIPERRCTVVIGPSGCGKSTLLRVIAGLEAPDSGHVRIGDRIVNAQPPQNRDVAIVFQDFALYPHMTLRKNLAFAGRFQGLARANLAERVSDAASRMGIENILDRKPGEVSGGERQRAAVARVLVRRPTVALYDEPLSNLDAGLRLQLRRDLKLLQTQHPTTSVFVTHDQEEAMSLADQIVVLADGEIQQVGAPLEVFHSPVNRFVASFIGSPSMNFIDGQVAAADGGVAFHHPCGFSLPLDSARAAINGRAVVLGFRPHAVSLDGEGPVISARVTVVEPLGTHSIVHCVAAGEIEITARLHATVSAGESLNLRVDPTQIHIFEPGEFGSAL